MSGAALLGLTCKCCGARHRQDVQTDQGGFESGDKDHIDIVAVDDRRSEAVGIAEIQRLTQTQQRSTTPTSVPTSIRPSLTVLGAWRIGNTP